MKKKKVVKSSKKSGKVMKESNLIDDLKKEIRRIDREIEDKEAVLWKEDYLQIIELKKLQTRRDCYLKELKYRGG